MHSAANLFGWPASQNPQISDRLLGRGSPPNLLEEFPAGQTGRAYELRFSARRRSKPDEQSCPEADWAGCRVQKHGIHFCTGQRDSS
jgi:hypothetical protein